MIFTVKQLTKESLIFYDRNVSKGITEEDEIINTTIRRHIQQIHKMFRSSKTTINDHEDLSFVEKCLEISDKLKETDKYSSIALYCIAKSSARIIEKNIAQLYKAIKLVEEYEEKYEL